MIEDSKRTIDSNTSVQILHDIPEQIDRKVFDLEYDVFSNTYEKCPPTYEDYRLRRSNRTRIATMLFNNTELAGIRMFELLSPEHCHSMMMGVKPRYSGQGIANLICAISAEYLKWQGINFITSWTHVDLQVAGILNRYAPIVSRSHQLSDLELSLRIAFEKSRNLEKEHFGQKRRIENYYKMVDGSNGDANFWVHEVR